ncbi:uncharacterized protein NPIL_617461 [Nephila pilipes]|uniref:Uncharacterized protein n=1 Tax=Nephila pilipes TaxID=299642 RepID=A0A8X6NR13_NEPPI|nr:uncharacterized protein NPIL_617461 [Nephila pilipes]
MLPSGSNRFNFNKGRNMLFAYVFLVAFGVASAYTGDREEVHKYVDKVLSEYLPKVVEDASLDVYEMPDFYFNVQDSSAEDEVFEGTVTFYSGNLTGLSTVHRKVCQSLSRSPDSIRIICNLVLPRIEVIYTGQYGVSTGYSSSYGVGGQKRNLYGKILIRDVEAQIELKKLDDVEKPTVTNILLLGKGQVTKRFTYIDVNENNLF